MPTSTIQEVIYTQISKGKEKRPVPGKCFICNEENPTKHSVLNASFCEPCWDAMAAGDEALEERMVWER
ncbi:hypothetical protein [Paenibacillus xylanexedens]|uniref:hypothetical protein n=1 Tax=Paenibacillus xylanexedens TaxID=528191 RepID=UPI0011A98E2E|nr:hypothetical protein [Paenibacillus xylanexedens]